MKRLGFGLICFILGIKGVSAQQETSGDEDDSRQIAIQRVDSRGKVVRFDSQKKYQWKFVEGGPCFNLSFEDDALKDATQGKINREKNLEAQISDQAISICMKERSGSFSYHGKIKNRSFRYHYIIDLPFKEPQIIADSKCRKDAVSVQGRLSGDALSVGVRCSSAVGGVQYRFESRGLILPEGAVLQPGQSNEVKFFGSTDRNEVGQLTLALKKAEEKPEKRAERRRVFFGDFMLGPSFFSQKLSAPFELINPSISGTQVRGLMKGVYELPGFLRTFYLAGAFRADLNSNESRLWILDLDLRKSFLKIGENDLSFGAGMMSAGSLGSDIQGIQRAWGIDTKLVLSAPNYRWSAQVEFAPIFSEVVSFSSYLLGVGGTYRIGSSGWIVGADLEWIHIPLEASGQNVDCRYTNILLSVGYRLGARP